MALFECPECKCKIERQTGRCSHCGVEITVCPKCDMVSVGETAFCRSCGYDLDKYYPQYKTANRGISGDTTVRLESRLQVSVYDLKPQVAVLLIGANNMDTMLDNYESILQGFATNLPQTRVVVLSLTAMGGEHWGRKNQLAAYNNVTLQLLASRYGYEYVDLFSPLYDVTIGEVREGYTVDGGHLTHEGYAVITAEITPVLQQILGK